MADKGPDITVITLPNPATLRTERLSYDSMVNYLSASGIKVHRLQPTTLPYGPSSYLSRINHRRKAFFSILRQLLPLRGTSAVLYLPFPGYGLLSMAARLIGFTLVFHLQKEQQSSRWLELSWSCLYRPCARHMIYYSEAATRCYPTGNGKYTVLGPMLDRKAVSRLESAENSKRAFPFTLLMVLEQANPAALERYISLARSLPSMQFLLLGHADILSPLSLPSNLQYSSRPNSRKSFFQQAHLLLQLDDRAQGYARTAATFLEGLSYGLPVIALNQPEQQQRLIQHNTNGFTFTPGQLDQLPQQILELSINREAYAQLSAGARQAAREQTAESVISRLITDLVPRVLNP